MSEPGQGTTYKAMESLFGTSPSRGRATDLPYLRGTRAACIADELWIPTDGIESASRSFCSERFKLNDICEQVVLVIKRHRLGFAT
jgi:hypothetical protein